MKVVFSSRAFPPVLLAAFVSSSVVFASDPAIGPYLQSVSQQGIIVSWETDSETDSDGDGLVEYGLTEALGSLRESTAFLSTCGRRHYDASLGGLQTDALYYYRVESGGETSGIFTFRSAPPPGSSFTFAVYGDNRSNYDDHPTRHGEVVGSILAGPAPDIVINAGDVVETGGWCGETGDFGWRPEYFTPGRELFASVPAFIAIGNHEYYPSGDPANYQEYFSFPDNGSADPLNEDLWYSFDYGAAHFVMIDSAYYEVGGNFAPGSEQYQWLSGDLAASEATWKFAVFHHPPYARSAYERPPLEEYLVPLFQRYGVQAVFCGHTHFYERSRARGIYYIVTGGGGAPLYPVGDMDLNPYSLFAASLNHHCRVELDGERLALFAVETNGDVFDSFEFDLAGDEDTDGYSSGDEFRSGWDPSDIYSPAPRSLAAGDYEGDGRDEIAIFRPASGLWAVRSLAGLTRAYFGQDGDWPVPGDYDGNEIAGIGVFRPVSGLWAVRGETRFYFGASGDIPVPGNYAGDGLTRPAIFRPSDGLWAVRGLTRFVFGRLGAQPVPADFDGDGTEEAAFFRMSDGFWNVRGSTSFYFGDFGALGLAADWEGDGTATATIFRAESGLWAARGLTRFYLGIYGDQPAPADYDGAGRDQAAIFRPNSGLWSIRDLSRRNFGSSGDMPVTR